MRRSICYCEPTYALAGEAKTWKFIYTPSTNLPKGTKLKFDLQTKGREIDWEIPSTNLKQGGGVIYALLGKGKVLSPIEIDVPDSFAPQYEFTLPSPLQAGETFTIVLGAKTEEEAKKKEGGTIRAQTSGQRRRPFLLYIDTTGKGRFEEPELFAMDVRGNVLSNIRIVAPSFVIKNKRFDVIVRFEDEFGNLTSNAHDDTLIELSHEHLRENLNWKLFIPETGYISLPNLYFNDEGTYTIQLRNTHTKELFRSSPIRCFSENSNLLLWGLLHGESDRFDSTENIENCLRHFRDDRAFNFYGVSPFENQEETPNDVWKHILQHVADFDENDRFTTFAGFQWEGENKIEGSHVLVYAKENRPIYRRKDLKSNTLKKIYKSVPPKELVAIPSLTMAKGMEYNFENFDPDFERVVEIYNSWGCSEMTKKEGNTHPISSSGSPGYQESPTGSVLKALMENYRFGFVAGGLDDRGMYSNLFDSDQEQYSPGLTAIISTTHSREGLIEAIYNRSCYATTGERIIIGLYIAGMPMGKEVSTADKPGLAVNRHISGYVAGTTKLAKVEIIRNGKVIKTLESDTYHLDFTYDDMSPLEKVVQKAKDKKPPFVFYYLRVTQIDGHMAWSSPIWIDYIPLSALPKTPKKALPVKPTPPKDDFLEEDDFEDEDEDFDDYEDEE
jgi:hypothetical protein